MIRALLILAALAGVAHAEPPMIARDDDPHDSLLGTRIAYGAIPVDGETMTTMGLEVMFDHPIFGGFRVMAEYEYLWIGKYDWDAHADNGVASLADSGHRMHVGIRHRLLDKDYARGKVQLFLDGEAGGGAMLVDRMDGALALPHGFFGIRAGLALDVETRWEYELFVRGLALRDGPGVVFGIGLVWGD